MLPAALPVALVLALAVSGCAPQARDAAGSAAGPAGATARGPVAACSDGTAGKLPLKSEWGATTSARPAASPATGPATAKTSGITLPMVTPAPTPQLPVTVTSCDGTAVSVTDVSRIVTIDLYGTLTEIVHGLGLGANVVGHDRAADFPEAAKGKVVTPSGHDLNAEAITALDPTLILTDTTIGPLEVQQQLRNIGIPVIFFDPARTLPGISHQINAVAAALGVPAAGTELNAAVGADMSAALAMVPHESKALRIAFLYVRGTAGVYLMSGPGSGADDMIEAIGATDVGTDIGLTMPFTQLTSEALIKSEPDVLLLMTGGLKSVGGVDGLLKIQGIAQTPAGASRRIVDVADGSLLGFGPRTGQVIKALSAAVYGATP
ncbi:hypothetical protein AL755_21105 [Arthrobacter sp. ERGS1:01]|nr:hypothetical protein AL755_21105 [Arthrobacter sp. ERGS1:01]